MAGNKNTCLGWHLASQRLWRRGALCRKAAKLIQHAGQVLLGCFIGCEADIEPTVQFVHNGLGVVIHDTASVGARTIICQQVTLGVPYPSGGGVPSMNRAPIIGCDVLVGCGAKLIGPITVGDGARIGANAVVLGDVPAGATVAGVPAKVVKRGDALCA